MRVHKATVADRSVGFRAQKGRAGRLRLPLRVYQVNEYLLHITAKTRPDIYYISPKPPQEDHQIYLTNFPLLGGGW